MPRVGEPADIESILKRIGETGVLPEPYAADPGRLFLAIHDQWVENGGTVAGKRRNSIRKLMELLEAEGTPVPSLRSKLNGETRLKDGEAAALLDVYFSHWRHKPAKGNSSPEYTSLRVSKPDKLRNLILRSLFGGESAVRLPEIEKERRKYAKSAEVDADDSVAFLAGRDVMLDNFRSSKVAITISTVGSVKGPTTSSAIRGFCEIIDDYWKIDREDGLDRIVIWIVDPRDRNIWNSESLAAFANAEQLATFFRAIRLLGDSSSEARWSWLSTHAVVVVGSQDVAVIDRLYSEYTEKLKNAEQMADAVRHGIKYSHFLLDTPPLAWLRSSQLAQLYGAEFEDLELSSFLLWLDDAETHWRYFGYAPSQTPIIAKDGKETFTKFLELGSPGLTFDRAASIVHAGACLRLERLSSDLSEDTQLRSLIILRHLDFAVFRLPEFLDAETLSKAPP